MKHSLVIKTIGVYGSTEESFFGALVRAGVDTFCDIRQRRLVRGSKYAYVNSTKLQHRLSSLGIKYVHIKALAPSTELRMRQKQIDEARGVTKVKRDILGDTFVEGYKQENLAQYSLESFLNEIPKGTHTICLFCVEREALACHRSIAAGFLAEKLNTPVENLIP
jgi:uncharacterized protein (DUF488 family)